MKKSFSIRTYLGISHTLLLVISLWTIGLIWSFNDYRVITRELEKLSRDRISQISKILGHEIEEHGGVGYKDSEFKIVAQEQDLVAVYMDKSGAMYELVPGSVSSYDKDLILKLSQQNISYEKSVSSITHLENNITGIYAAAPVLDAQNQSLGIVCMLLPVEDLDSYISNLRWMLLLAMLLATLLGLGISALINHSFSRHFSNAQRLAAMVSEGSFQLRIPESGPTELRDLSHYLNVLAEKLQDQTKKRQTLLSNVAHELARPLAGLLLGIESLRKGAIHDLYLADDLLASMGDTIEGLECLVEDITLAAQPNTLPIEIYPKPLPVETFLQSIATRFWSLAKSRGLKIEVQVEQDLPPLFADERRLIQIMGNLMDNAIKFTPRNKTISLSGCYAGNGNIKIIVQDGGKGIMPREAEHLFEPFYQGDSGRRIKQGMGLGLSISQKLAQAHGGSLELKNHPQGGAMAILTLPSTKIT